jgi:hypothetical protein
MKKIVFFFLFASLPCYLLYPQQQELSKTYYYEVHSGRLEYNMTLYSSMLFGIGSKNMMTNSTLRNDGTESIFWNPAGLGFLKKGEVFIDFAPPVYVSPDMFIDFQDEANKMVDDEYEEKMDPNSTIQYPIIKTKFNSGSRLQSFGFSLPFDRFSFAAAYFNQFELKVKLLLSGLGVLMEDYIHDIHVVGVTSDTTTYAYSSDFSTNLNIFSDALSLGFAYQPIKPLAIGLAVEMYNVSATNVGYSTKTGWIYRSTGFADTLSFNDPNAGYNSSLLDTMNGSFHGRSVGLKLAGVYRFSDISELALTIYVPFNVDMKGNMYIVNSNPVFFANGEINERYFTDPRTQNEPTRTSQTRYHFNRMKIKLPGNIKLGYTQAVGKIAFIFNAGYSFNEFSYRYTYIEEEENVYEQRSKLKIYHQGIKPGADLHFAIDFGNIKLGTGIIFSKLLKDDKEKDNIIIPLFSLAFGFPVGEHLTIGGHLFSLTFPFSRITLGYRF